MRAFSAEPYFQIADEKLGLLSVFDDLKYDRADVDMISPAMRKHVVGKLGPLGFRQTSGTVSGARRGRDMRVHIPKFHALGASPFDIARYTEKRPQDYCLLTPTQVACQYVDHYELDDAVQRIEVRLIAKSTRSTCSNWQIIWKANPNTAPFARCWGISSSSRGSRWSPSRCAAGRSRIGVSGLRCPIRRPLCQGTPVTPRRMATTRQS